MAADETLESLPLGQPLGGAVGSAFRTPQGPGLQILVGFKINGGDVIDGLIPVFAELRSDGTLSAPADGPVYGRKGSLKPVLAPGYHVVGVDVYEGLWYGTDTVKQLKVYWKKWNSSETRESAVFGIGPEKGDKGRALSLRVPEGQAAAGIYGLADRNALNRFSLIATRGPAASQTVLQTSPQPAERPQRPAKPQETPTVPVVPEKPTATVTSASELFIGLPKGDEAIKSTDAAFEKEVLALINQERKKAGLPALSWDEDLARAARYHAADMSHDGYFDHNTMDKGPIKVAGAFDRIRRFSSKGHSENIAWNQPSPEAVVASWMTSPGHKANILAARSTLLGVGYYGGYWVQVFGN